MSWIIIMQFHSVSFRFLFFIKNKMQREKLFKSPWLPFGLGCCCWLLLWMKGNARLLQAPSETGWIQEETIFARYNTVTQRTGPLRINIGTCTCSYSSQLSAAAAAVPLGFAQAGRRKGDDFNLISSHADAPTLRLESFTSTLTVKISFNCSRFVLCRRCRCCT